VGNFSKLNGGTMRKQIQPNTDEYAKDFYAWSIKNAKLIREGKLTEVDLENVAEEIESMGKSEKRELINRLAVLISHLLKWQYQPARRGNSWKYTIKEQRLQITKLIKDSPSLKHILVGQLDEAYEYAVYHTLSETELDEKTFPSTSPYSLVQIFDDRFYPER
jgi:hypothetical protein